MSLYSFINSKDIRKYLQKIKYPFSSLEAARLIYQCHSTTLKEKHAAWRELIQTMPDCAIEERPNTAPHDSLHRFLVEYMERENLLLEAFVKEDNSVYQWSERQENHKFDYPAIYSCY